MVSHGVKVIHGFRFGFQSPEPGDFRLVPLTHLLEEKTEIVMGPGPGRHSVAELVRLTEKAGIEPAAV